MADSDSRTWPKYRFVADARTGSRLAGAYLRITLLRPRALVTWAGMLLVVVIFGVTQHQIGTAVTVVVAVFLAVIGMQAVRTRRTFSKVFAPGSVHTTSFGPDSMTSSGPLGSSEIRYAAYREIRTGRNAVVLRRRDAALFLVSPAPLFPPAAVTHVRAQIAATAGTARGGGTHR